jgi:hypothetical protein
VAQIGRQVWQKALNILTFSIPGHKPSHRECVAEVMKAWLEVKTIRAFHSGFISNAFKRDLGRQCVTGRPSYVARNGAVGGKPVLFHFLSK